MRIALLATDASLIISCPHIWDLESSSDKELFIVKEHANISANSPGLGPNIDEYGPRFYDISHVYERGITQKLMDKASSF